MHLSMLEIEFTSFPFVLGNPVRATLRCVIVKDQTDLLSRTRERGAFLYPVGGIPL